MQIPLHIQKNLNPKFQLRPYQKKALYNFIDFLEKRDIAENHLLFEMATGSGKTLIMAACILHLYQKGYKNFLFFVNSTSIIKKTKDNFLNNNSLKFLFNENINFSSSRIFVQEVDNFEPSQDNCININFSTIQGLHSKLQFPRENALTFEDLSRQKIVFISDEAHHINSETKKGKLNKNQKENLKTWEGTVKNILKQNKENLLLEFTATIDWQIPEIEEKYKNKLIFDYGLRQFGKEGYSKEVKILQTQLEPFEKTLQAILLSQYRKKIAEKYNLFIKAVILCKSKTIKESEVFFEEFHYKLKKLSINDIKKIQKNTEEKPLKNLFTFLENQKVSLENFVEELKIEFSENKSLLINSKNDSENKQLIINNLEDKKNPYRIIFSVDKLNEGWDVLNLFDIVKLYESKSNLNKITLSEAQLIGRGARYYPFQVFDNQLLYQRKYDNDLENELRICEELYYHTSKEVNYIQSLDKALKKIGIRSLENEKYLKSTITEKINTAINFKEIPKKILENIFETRQFNPKEEKEVITFNEFPEVIIRKAMNQNPFFYFSNLKKYFPDLTSITEFIHSENYLKKVQFKKNIRTLKPQEKLQLIKEILEQIQSSLIR